MSSLAGRFLLAAALLFLAGCGSQAVRTSAPSDPLQAAANDAQRDAMPGWLLEGRVALSNGRQGGSGRIDWVQDGDGYAISLGAPVTRQSWRLQGDPAWARLDGIEGGPREGADVEALLLAATGWEIPVRAMVAWVRGMPADAADYGPAAVVAGGGSLPARIEQAGWRIDYRDWHPPSAQLPALPKRIEAARGEARVRLVVDRWEAPAP